MTDEHVGTRYDRLPASDAAREREARPTRTDVLDYFEDRFGIGRATFDTHTFWEKGKGKIWAFAGTFESPIAVEALGIHLLRTNQRHWKPTTDGAQRFGHVASRNALDLDPPAAAAFWAGETQEVGHDADPGYVIVRRPIAGSYEPLGVGLLIGDELRSQVPKGRRRDLRE